MMNIAAFAGKTILVTGATGLIGKAVVRALLDFNAGAGVPVGIVACCRNRQKAEALFGPASGQLQYLIGDIRSMDFGDVHADYVIHAASQTSSRGFVEDPVGTIFTAVDGTRRVLDYAVRAGVEHFLFLSTMEVYGIFQSDEKVDEQHPSHLDTMAVRSCYPESKRLCEVLCTSYARQYGLKVHVLRLTQTFGRGVEYHDGRVFAEFARCAIEGRDIVLKTKGETKRCYLAVDDAVDAIFTVLLAGKDGEAYNAANEETYCSIREMAELVARDVAGGRIRVRIEAEDVPDAGYAPVLHMNLDTSKLRSLGWRPGASLPEMFRELTADMEKRRSAT